MHRSLFLALFLTACSGDDDTDSTASAECVSGCEATVEAACPNGPADAAECEADCTDLLAGDCATEYGDYLACAEGSTLSCDPDLGIPVVDDCPTERVAFLDCING